ncbi:unnamed protein product [Closterium sp. Naga37s-1]|nr:unnamed protein product [Closterium sp. Naga37s-1]
MCAHISGNLLSALQTAGLTLPPQKLTRTGAVPTSADVSEMSGVVRETSSDVQTLKKDVAALRAEQADLHSKFSSVSKQLFERVAALEKARETGNTGGGLGAPGHPDVTSPSKRVDSSPDPGLRDTAASPIAGVRQTSRFGPNEDAAPPQQHQREPHYASASPSPAPGTAQQHQTGVPPGRDTAYYQPGTSRPAPPLRPVAPLTVVPRPAVHRSTPPPPQQSYPPPAIPSMSGAGEGGGEWMRDSGGDAGAAGATSDAFTGGRAKSKYAGVTGGGRCLVCQALDAGP